MRRRKSRGDCARARRKISPHFARSRPKSVYVNATYRRSLPVYPDKQTISEPIAPWIISSANASRVCENREVERSRGLKVKDELIFVWACAGSRSDGISPFTSSAVGEFESL